MKLLKEQLMKIFKAFVFDIKRFAVHDGTGLRTTIFFKGCPLRCRWCQNPEGLNNERQVIYFKKKCIHCRSCQRFEDKVIYKNDRPYFKKQQDFDQVIKTCPSGAIQYDSHEYTLDELMEKIKEDEVFYKHGGGVTFSGGEPFMQGEFLIEILKRCKKEKIHTAIETSFYTSLELIKKALPYLDLIYIDLKIFDETKHQAYTNVSSKLIKENIHYVLQSKYKDKVIIRTPLIPTMSATDGNIKQIVQFLIQINPEVKYEMLNYNPLASAKYELVNLKYGLESYQTFNKLQMQHFYDVALQAGIKNLIKE